MDIFKYYLLALGIIFFVFTFVIAVRSQKAFRFLFYNAVIALLIFFLIYFTKEFIGIDLHINKVTIFGSAIFGVPAIIAFLFLNLIF